jgi:dihydrofolate reductase
MTTDMVIDPLEGWFEPGLAMADGLAQLRAADAIILGRETYEKLAGFWPKSDDEWAELINPMPKHVASRTVEEPLTWNAQLLGADLASDVAALKKRYSGDLILYGIGEFASYLAHGEVGVSADDMTSTRFDRHVRRLSRRGTARRRCGTIGPRHRAAAALCGGNHHAVT